ncbi:hypothetical protein [Streptomyces sp. NPDC002619]|uniref:hypothetical protein n=1 Tax=Streptomyces sp. NPDC002619 TaxID=3364655 RepID=UPI0036CA8E5B
MAVYGTSWGIAGIAAPVVGTRLLQYMGASTLWLAMSGACLALAITQPFLARAVAARTSPLAATASPSAPSVENPVP